MRTRRLIPLLAACSAIGSVANFLFLPALPQIAAYFHVSAGTAQLTVTAYLIAFAVGVLLSGPVADRYGRRPLLLGGLTIAAGGSLLAWAAPSMAWFVFARVVQGLGGGVGITVSRACVGDLFHERELARMYAILTMALVLGTSLAPYAGGLIAASIGWHAGFLLLAAAALLIAAAAAFWLEETRSAALKPHSFAVLWQESRTVIARGAFAGYVLQAALIYSMFLVFVSVAPHVMSGVLGMPPDRFGLYYLFLAAGFFLGNLQVSRSGANHDVARQAIAGLALQFLGALLALGFVLCGLAHPLYVFVPMVILSFGQGLTLPNVIAQGIRLAPNYPGVASSVFGFAQLAIAALAVQLMGFVTVTSWQPALWFCVCGSLVAFTSSAVLQRHERARRPA